MSGVRSPYNSLLLAIKGCDIPAMHNAFDAGVPPDSEELLWKAAGTGRTEVVQALFDRGTKEVNKHQVHGKDCKNAQFTLPLSNAVHRGHHDVARLLLEKSARVERPAIRSAVLKGDMQMLRLFTERGVSLKDHLYDRQEEVTLRNGTRVIACEGSLAHDAAASGNVELTRTLFSLLPQNINVFNGEGKTPVHVAVEKNKPEALRVLLALGADVNACTHFSALQLAVSKSRVDCARILLQANPSEDRISMINQAAALDDEAMVRLLLEFQFGTIPQVDLCSAVHKGNPLVVGLLLQKGANVHQSEGPTGSALHWATRSRWVTIADQHHSFQTELGNIPGEVVELLLAGGADINALSPDGTTPLYAAVTRGNTDAVRVLLSHSQQMQLDTKSKVEGLTPLEKAKAILQDIATDDLRIVNRFTQQVASCTKVYIMLLAKQALLRLESIPPFQEKEALQNAFTHILNHGVAEGMNSDECELLSSSQIPCVLEFFAGLFSQQQ